MKSTHVLVAAFSSLLAQQVYAATQYQVTQLPSIPNAFGISGQAINNNGQIAVTADFQEADPSGQPIFVNMSYLFSNGVYTSLYTPPGYVSAGVSDVNDNGDAVGEVTDTFGNISPVLWHNGTATILSTGSFSQGVASSINNNGQISGAIGGNQLIQSNAALWNGTSLTDLGNFGTDEAGATRINNNGQLLISAYNRTTDLNTVLIHQNTSDQLLSPMSTRGTFALNMNDAGEVIGQGSDGPGYLWNDNTYTNLPLIPGTNTGEPLAINNNGDIVGMSLSTTPYVSVPTLWQNGQAYDLNSLIPSTPGFQISSVNGINDNGDILAFGGIAGSATVLLLTPTTSAPEPTTLSLLSLAALPLLTRRRPIKSSTI